MVVKLLSNDTDDVKHNRKEHLNFTNYTNLISQDQDDTFTDQASSFRSLANSSPKFPRRDQVRLRRFLVAAGTNQHNRGIRR